MATQNAIVLKNADDLKIILAKNYQAQIKNFFGDEKRAMRFLSSVMSSVQSLPALLTCEPMSVINSFMTMAQLGLMPSNVSGEAYVLPYDNKNGKIAQFQLGYQGLVTLFYRAGVQSVRAEIVRKNDVFSFINGKVRHEIDIFKSNKERGEAVGAYAIGVVNGEEIAKVMNKADIMAIGQRFSKSFKSSFTPWQEAQDPELWMWKKTVLKQLGKLLPKNDTIFHAINADNEADGNLKPIGEGMVESSRLNMGSFAKDTSKYEEKSKGSESQENEAGEDDIAENNQI